MRDVHTLVNTCTDKEGKDVRSQQDLNLCVHYDNGGLAGQDK